MTVYFQWDERKRPQNLEKHRLDFKDAACVYMSDNKLTYQSPVPEEQRYLDVAAIDETVYSLVYTVRQDRVRFISFRRASRQERRRYDQDLQQEDF